ncbi:DinB family protein [Bacillus haynesii]|uniref:DinB family protein n=1 Tax=Bacillus haynesii TaxID=1925021 RepID=UPI00227EE91F|nr:DinB family protein [Bacillus haynesii]MCY7816846.1 DinB family protein [Bacillus haynesii]MCY8223842.1 DinB family protein [Bacillus haynesii]MCY8243776.1 DinB family protein [Bacillus haynesii]MCY8372890.1 DinB family protein [Bacillus haynesii]MCY8569600.1 DinB family protein [Bacillus haynesii]
MTHRALKHLDYHNWANQRVLSHLKSLPEELFTREIKSVFQSVSEVVTHMCVADALWLKIISGAAYEEAKETGMRLKEGLKGKKIVDFVSTFHDTALQYEAFFENLEDPDGEITIAHPIFGEIKTPISEILHHVVNHGTYHRGNISAMLRQMGEAGVPTDYVYYLLGMKQTT